MATPAEMTPVLEQWQIFLALSGAGLVLAFAFDCYRVGRYFWRPRVLGTYAGDFLLWSIFTVFTFAFILLVNWGEVRAYVFLAIFIGAGLYMLFLSRQVLRGLYVGGYWLVRILNFSRRLLGRTLFVVFIPGRWVLAFLSWPISLPGTIWRRWHRSGGPPI